MSNRASWCLFQSSDVETIRQYKKNLITKDDMEDINMFNNISSSSEDNESDGDS